MRLGLGINLMLKNGGGSSAFSPASIPNLAFWYDASQLTLANNDPVGSFTDLSGNGRHLVQATASYKPLFLTNRQNGLPGVVGDGVDDFLQSSAFTLNQPVHYFIVAKINTTGPGFLFDGNANSSTRFTRNNGVGGQMFLYAGFFSGPITTGVDTAVTHCYAVLADGANSKISVDGATASTGNPGSINPGGVNLFGFAGGVLMDAEVFEFIGYTEEKTGAALAALQSYLQTKWGY